MVIPAPVPVASATIQAIGDYGCTLVYGTPTMYADIVNCDLIKEIDGRSLQRAVMSGAPCPPQLAVKLRNHFQNLKFVSLPYGCTETSPLITMPEVDEDQASDDRKLCHVGLPLQHVELKLVDSVGRMVERGYSGEVLVRGHNIMAGYWGEADKTKEVGGGEIVPLVRRLIHSLQAIDDRRWYHTGDVGVMDDEDRLSIVGRIKDLVIRGGENIYPREIEDLLVRHPEVVEVNVVGVPDERLGEELCACVIPRAGVQKLSHEDVKQFLKDQVR